MEKKVASIKITKNKIIAVLDKIRPSLQMDGGDLKFVSFDEKKGILNIELVGMCAHCSMSQITLKQGIEEEVRKEVPEVKEVRAV